MTRTNLLILIRRKNDPEGPWTILSEGEGPSRQLFDTRQAAFKLMHLSNTGLHALLVDITTLEGSNANYRPRNTRRITDVSTEPIIVAAAPTAE